MEREIQTSTFSPSSVYAKVFGWMALALFITFAVAIGGTFFLGAIDPSLYIGILIGASILEIVLVFVINFSGLLSKRQGAVKIPFILYSICMGILMSSIIAVTEVTTIIYAFGATFLCFGAMALIGWFGRNSNMKAMHLIAMGLGIGSLILVLANFFMRSGTVDWIVSFAMFAFILLITAVDVWRMRQFAEAGAMTENFAIFFAFQIYYDFIYIFLKVLRYIQISKD